MTSEAEGGNLAAAPKKAWKVKTLLIICICLFSLMTLSVSFDDETEAEIELREVKSELQKTKSELKRSKSDLTKTQSELKQVETDFAESKANLTEAEIALVKTETKLVQAQSTTQSVPSVEDAEKIYEGLTNIPDYTYRAGLQIGMVLGAHVAFDAKTAAVLCEETTIDILKSLTKEYFEPVPANEEKQLFYYSAFFSIQTNSQTMLNDNSMDCDVSTPLGNLLDAESE